MGRGEMEGSVPGARPPKLFLVGCIAIYSIGTLGGWLAPQMLFGAMHHYHVSAAQGGLLTLVEGVTCGLLSMALGVWPPRMTHRLLAILGVMLYVAMNAVSPWAPNFLALVGIRFLVGVADAILVFVAVSLVAMKSANPDRSYAALNVFASIYGAAVIAALPILSPSAQGLLYLPFSAAVAALIAATLAFLPADTRPGRLSPDASSHPPTAHAKAPRIVLLLGLIMIPQAAQSFGIFTFSPGIGARLGMSEAEINGALGSATLVSIVGPFAAAAFAQRFGRWGPMLTMAMLMLAGNILLTTTDSQAVFRLCLLIDLTGAYFFVPLLLGWCADLDPTGRASSVMMGGLSVVSALTPALIGALVDYAGLPALLPLVVGTGFAFTIFILFLRVAMRAERVRPLPA